MSQYHWPHSQNFFLPHLQKSYPTAFDIMNEVDTKLHNGIADAAINTLYTVFHPVCTDFNSVYYNYNILKSSNPGVTLSVKQLEDELSSTYIGNWDVEIQRVYNRKTSQYKTLLPKHRAPFQTGNIPSKVLALTVLIDQIGTDVALATIKGEVVTFLDLLQGAVDAQGGKGSSIDTATALLNTTVVNSSFALLAVYSGLMVKFYLTPNLIETYLPIEYLHNVQQASFTITLTDVVPHFIAKRKFDISKDTIAIKNSSTSTAAMYFTNGMATTPTIGAPIVTIEAESNSSFNPAVMGYTDVNRHLYVVSNDGLSTLIAVTFM